MDLVVWFVAGMMVASLMVTWYNQQDGDDDE